MDYSGALCPCLILFSFFAYWIVLMPSLWYLYFLSSVKNQWPEYWHIIFWLTVFILWLVLALMFLSFLAKRHRQKLKEKSEQIKGSIVEKETDCQSGFEMNALNHSQPVDIKDSGYINQNDKSKCLRTDVKTYNSVDGTNVDLILKNSSRKAEQLLGCRKTDYKSDSNNKKTEPVSVIRTYRQPHDTKLIKDVDKRKSCDIPAKVKIENETDVVWKKRNTFHATTRNFSTKPLVLKGPLTSSVDPLERVFSREYLVKKDNTNLDKNNSFHIGKNSDEFVTKPVQSFDESDQGSETEKVIFQKVSFKKRPKNNAEKLYVQKDQDVISGLNDNQLSDFKTSRTYSEPSESESKIDNNGKNIPGGKTDVTKTSNSSRISESTSRPQSTADSGGGSYKGLPHIENFDKYLKLVAIDTPMSPRDSFFSDLMEAGKAEDVSSTLPTSDSDVFSDPGSPTREYFVADVRPRLSSVKTEAFIVIDDTAETNKLASKRFILVEDNNSDN